MMAVATTSPLAFQPSFSYPFAVTTRSKLTFPFWQNCNSFRLRNGLGVTACTYVASSSKGQAAFDPELRSVLELATDSELYELERILFGPSYFSPLLKSLNNRADVDFVMIEQDLEERENFIASLESRFLFLAADARSTLRGWRPSYRNVLLAVRKNLNIPCSSKLSTEDLEVEIFLHLLQEYASEESGVSPGLWEKSEASDAQNSLELGLSQWKVQALTALKVGATELKSMMLKGGGIYTLAKAYQLLTKRLSGKLFVEAANYQIKKEVLKKGGQLAAINLESRAALLAAKQGFAGAATRYLGLRSMVALLSPKAKTHISSILSIFVFKTNTNMGFPVAYSELIVPKLILHTLSLLGFIRKLITILFTYLGLQDFLEPDDIDALPPRAAATPRQLSVSALLIREILPVVKFSDLVDPQDSCAVCLYEFEEQDEIRRLTNCRHIFHRCCLDRWMAYDQKTCPLCRTPFIPDDMQESFNERLWAASGISEFYYDGEFSQIATDL